MSRLGEFLAFCKTAIDVIRPKEINGALVNALVEAFTKISPAPLPPPETPKEEKQPIITHVMIPQDFTANYFDEPFVCYTIRNKVTGSMYVGRSAVGFNRRYGGNGAWWENHHNSRLVNDVVMYGRLNFTVNIYVCQDETDMMSQEANLLRSNRPLTYNVKAEPDTV